MGGRSGDSARGCCNHLRVKSDRGGFASVFFGPCTLGRTWGTRPLPRPLLNGQNYSDLVEEVDGAAAGAVSVLAAGALSEEVELLSELLPPEAAGLAA